MSELLKILIFVCGMYGIYGLDIQCNIHYDSRVYIKGPTCKPSNVIVKNKNEILETVNGLNSEAYNGSHVKMLWISGQTVNFIPQGIGKFFPNLEGLQIYNSELKAVYKKDLENLPKLKMIYLYGNKITTLSQDLFEGNPELFDISFEDNELVYINEKLVTNLSDNLKHVNFETNPCINHHYIRNDYRDEIPMLLKDLKTKCKNISDIDDLLQEIIELKAELATVTTQNNKLKSKLLSCDANFDAATRFIFSSTSSYQGIEKDSDKSVSLKCKIDSYEETCKADNFTVVVPDSTITELLDEDNDEIDQDASPIKKLIISDQQTLFLPSNLAEMFLNLVEIVITNSGLFQIHSKTFANLNTLTSIKINQNKLREIHSTSFPDNGNLRELNLSSNRIELLTDEAFASLPNLRILDLSGNLLTYLKVDYFGTLNSLEILNLKNNKLKYLDFGLFSPMTQLSTVDISDNALRNLSGDLVAAKNNITEFRVAGNELITIDQKLIRRLRKSHIIDLSGNKCTNDIYDNDSFTSVSIEILMSKISLECAEDDD